jgi:hypothetical protein
MIRDSVVEEVRAIRDEIAREHSYDIDAIFESLRKAEACSDRAHVTLEPRKESRQPATASDLASDR